MVYSVSPKTFEGLVTSHDGVILRVTYGADTDFPAVIEDYFDTEYRGAVVYGAMRWEDMPVPAWREKHFKGYGGRELVRGGIVGQPGFYLFLKGKAWHYEPEVALSNAYTQAVFKLQLEGKAVLAPPAKLPSWQNAVIAGIEKYLSTSMMAVSIKAAARRAPKAQPKPKPRGQTPPPPSPGATAPPRPSTAGHYILLGVPRDATRETVDKVFRLKSRGCHPDGYSGLPAEVRAGAEAEFKRLTNARDGVYVERGWV